MASVLIIVIFILLLLLCLSLLSNSILREENASQIETTEKLMEINNSLFSVNNSLFGLLNEKKHTYTTTLTRDDWVIFTQDAIDGVTIEALTNEEQEHYKQAKAIRAKLNAHRNLTF